MPFDSNDDLPARVKDNIPSKTGKDLFRQVVNQELDGGRSESVSFAAAWAALENAGFERNDDGKWVKKADGLEAFRANRDESIDIRTPDANSFRRSQSQIAKRTTALMQVSKALPSPSAVHVPSTGRKKPRRRRRKPHMSKDEGLLAGLREMRKLLFGEAPTEDGDMNITGTILKADEEQRIVWGWASVVTEKGEPVVDSQGDIIEPAEMEKAANAFMLDARMAKAMHEGDGIGEVIHSLPLTKALGEALGIESDREGWIIAIKVHDDDIWARVKSNELQAFSIGGHYEHAEEADG